MSNFLVCVIALLCPSLGSAKFKSNGNIEIRHDELITPGDSTSFTVAFPEKANQSLSRCEVINPQGDLWTFAGKLVYNKDAQIVPGYSHLGSSRACGIQIDSVNEEDLGSWRVILTKSSKHSPDIEGVVNLQKPEDIVYRLPGTVTPLHYDLSLVALWEPNWSIEGHLKLDVDVNSFFEDIIVLHTDNLDIDEDSVVIEDLKSGEKYPVLGLSYDLDRQFFGVMFESWAPTQLRLSLSYTGLINQWMQVGLFLHHYTNEDNSQVPFVASQFEAVGARNAFPCMDEPGFKSTFAVQLGHPDALTALSNMPSLNTKRSVAGHPGYVWTQFEPSVPMSTYLVAFAISDYKTKTAPSSTSSVLHRAWARPAAVDSGYLDYAVQVQAQLIAAYEEYFSVEYPLPKMDQFAIPNFVWGGMENWGLITYREEAILIEPTLSAAEHYQSVLILQAHENAHQWFGNLVTTHWWTNIWLNEGFATYVSYLGSDIVAPAMHNMDYFVQSVLQRALKEDVHPNTHSMTHPVTNPGIDIGGYFNFVSYEKAGSVIRSGYKMLQEVIRRYLKKHAFSNAQPEELFKQWEIAGKEDGTFSHNLDMTEIMKTWTTQNNFPILTVNRDYHLGTALLAQTRFVKCQPRADGHKWWIPITFTTVNDEDSNFNDTHNHDRWLSPENGFFVHTGGKDSALIFNVQFTGYYRVNYDEENWHRIAKELEKDHEKIHHLNRAQILFDADFLYEEALLSQALYFELIAYLGKERHYTPLAFAKNIYEGRRCSNKKSALCTRILSAFKARYGEVGLAEQPESSFMKNRTQAIVAEVMCDSDQPSCVADAVDQFGLWMNAADPDNLEDNPVFRHARKTVYCTALRHHQNNDAYSFLMERKEKKRGLSEVQDLISGLACIPNAEKLAVFLQEEEASLKGMDTASLAKTLSMNRALTEAVNSLVSENEVLSEPVVDVLVKALELGNTQEELGALKALRAYAKEDEIEKAIEAVKARL